MSPLPSPRLAFYGDDFTGSTDALESLTQAGLRTVLFLEPPMPEEVARFPHLDAIGVAGATRSLSPSAMESALRPAFNAFRQLGIPLVHYKICSTFDSSPKVGSIGKAIDVGMQIFTPPFVPIIAGAPSLGRHCVFGNLFARYGTGGIGELHRLDRHPSMTRHPVTPADESDLLRHLSRQTKRPMALLDILALREPGKQAEKKLATILERKPEIVFFDLLDQEQLPLIGFLLDQQLQSDRTLFVVGSSGVGMALGAHWQTTGTCQPRTTWPLPPLNGPSLVLSGSASPITASQIESAVNAGFQEVALDTSALLRGEPADVGPIFKALSGGQSVVTHTCRGPDDPRLQLSPPSAHDTAPVLGIALGDIARQAACAQLTRRIIFAGGDTSSHAGRALGLRCIEMIGPRVPGAPLCRAHSLDPAIDGLQLNFKGGQVGDTDYFHIASH